MKDKVFNNTGITLVALVITIIILLILAGISIAQLTGNGLFENAKLAKEKSKNAQEKEQAILSDYANKMNDYYNGITTVEPEDNTVKARYLLFDVYDHIAGDGAVISEIEIYDTNNEKINYTIMEDLAYDSVTNSLPVYWKYGGTWNYTNLYDGETAYTSNAQGGLNTTVFFFLSSAGTSPNSGHFVRFIIDLGEEKQLADINVCVGNAESRMPKEISVYILNNIVDTTYQTNLVGRKDDNLTKIKTIQFGDVQVQPTWYAFIEKNEVNNTAKLNGRYILFDVYDHIAGLGAVVSEISIYDANNLKTNYTVLENMAYDSATQSLPACWKYNGVWNYTNLYDGEILYGDNSQGGANSTALLFVTPYSGTSAYTGHFARFIIDLGEEKDITDIKMCLGDVENRTPKEVSAYILGNVTDTTYQTNVVERKDDNLTKVKKIGYDTVVTQPTWYSFVK